ncbi:MAG: hypothetical protein ABFR75_01830 [Acidobacteriota bacterium]
MDIISNLIQFKRPSQYIYLGTEVLSVFNINGRKTENIGAIKYNSIEDLKNNDNLNIKKILKNTDSGVILNSGDFVFNLLNFVKIPLRKKLKDEIVEWRVQKVFPENMENYFHEYFQLSSNLIFSILIRKKLKDEIEALFEYFGIELIYFGNSTVEIINNLRRTKKNPDFFIEYEGDLMIVVFMDKGIPYYFRKFRVNNSHEASEEIQKTVEYVKKNYNKIPGTYSVLSVNFNDETLIEELNRNDFIRIGSGNSEYLIIPGQR